MPRNANLKASKGLGGLATVENDKHWLELPRFHESLVVVLRHNQPLEVLSRDAETQTGGARHRERETQRSLDGRVIAAGRLAERHTGCLQRVLSSHALVGAAVLICLESINRSFQTLRQLADCNALPLSTHVSKLSVVRKPVGLFGGLVPETVKRCNLEPGAPISVDSLQSK